MPPKNILTAKNAQTTDKASSSKTKSGASGNTTKISTPKTKPVSATETKDATASPSAKVITDGNKFNKEWTLQDNAALKIQSKFRQFLARKNLERRREEKMNYEAQMEKLEKEAFLHLIKMEQEEAERKRKIEEDEKKRKQEANKKRKRMLEAAFDGDVNEMKQVVKEVSDLLDKDGIGNDVIGRSLRAKRVMDIIECEDANGNTALSEAANGGHADAIKFLLDNGADPNTQGQFMRTPLYRAAFAGHLAAVQTLLDNGADPRMYASDSQCPAEVASTPAIQEVLENWDISRTEAVLVKLRAAKEKRAEEDRKRRDAETSKLENIVAEAKKDYESKQKMLDHACSELNKRIHEHDTCIAQGFSRPEITLQCIHDQEFEVENIRVQVAQARDNLAKVRIKLRESMAGSDEEVEDKLPGMKVSIRELDDVLFRDAGNKIADSGKWPFLIDPSGQATTFLRYRDTNYVNALRPADMESNNVRMCLLGALRYGKPFVLDMMEVDIFETCTDRFDEIIKGLMGSIIDKSILQEDKYIKLIKELDGPEYDKSKFNGLRIGNFKFILVTQNPFPDEKLLDKFCVIRIVVNI
ncbi:hypothetical protein BsWGS_19323 [Bradybaena similaris]